MQILFAIIVLLIIFMFGLVPLVLGIVGLIISKVRKKKGKRVPSAIPVLSIIGIVLGTLIAAVPAGFFGFIFYTNVTLRDNVAETDIVIEEVGYQSERFTADGVVYVAADDLETDFYVKKQDAVFTYKYGDNILKRSQWGNYYKVENPHGFNLVCDSFGLLYCPEDELEAVREKYSVLNGYRWEVCGTPLSQEASKLFEELIEETDGIEIKTVTVDFDDNKLACILKMSTDGVIYVHDDNSYYDLLIHGDSVYYILDRDYDNDGEKITYALISVPSLLSGEVLDSYNSHFE